MVGPHKGKGCQGNEASALTMVVMIFLSPSGNLTWQAGKYSIFNGELCTSSIQKVHFFIASHVSFTGGYLHEVSFAKRTQGS